MYLQLNWTDIPDECKNGVILGFVVLMYEFLDEENFARLPDIYINESLARSYKLDNITFNTYFNISVAGRTRKGIGNAAAWNHVEFGEMGMDLNVSTYTSKYAC